MKLPIASESPCFGCYTPCCFSYVVPLTAFDLWRLERATEVPWQHLAEVVPGSVDYWDSFRLDEGARRWSLRLRHKSSSLACHLLVELPGGQQRCGAHAGRPLACRAYPLKAVEGGGIEFISHAMCPPAQRRQFAARTDEMQPVLVEEMSDLTLHLRALERWDARALEVSRDQPLQPGDYVAWMRSLYDATAALRRGPRAEWEAAVTAAIDSFPLPDVSAVGC